MAAYIWMSKFKNRLIHIFHCHKIALIISGKRNFTLLTFREIAL